MLILAIESSAKPVSAAVYSVADTDTPVSDTCMFLPVTPALSHDSIFDKTDTAHIAAKKSSFSGKLIGQSFQNNGFSHSRTLLAMVESLLKNLEITLSDIGLIAVSHGPGSFTGVRIGVSAAKGLAWGLDIPVCGVSTLEAMAYQASGIDSIICPVMDARREQVYNALFKCQEGILVRLCEDRAISLEELSEELKQYNSSFMLIGDGVDVCKESNAFKNGILSQCITAPELMRHQTAYGVAIAAINADKITAAELEPYYLRPSQAEREKNTYTSRL